jgi:FkbM family methyltransferase
MFKQLRSYVKRYPSMVNLYTKFHKLMDRPMINNVRDIFDSYLRKGRKAEVTPYGFKLQGSSSIHHRRMQKGAFEEEETTLIRRHLTQSEAFIDVGANIGFYSCLARSLGKSVVAVEPLNGNLNHLYANLIENKWSDVEVFPVGLSDQPGLSVLYGASSTGASLIGNWAGASKRIRRVIPVSTLDILLGERFAGKKLFIKIDVEGVEYQVLMGAIKTMQLNPRPTWIIEICLNEFYPGGFNPNYQATFNLFWQQGYEIRTADNEYKLIKAEDVERWVNAGRCDSGVINYFFIPV